MTPLDPNNPRSGFLGAPQPIVPTSMPDWMKNLPLGTRIPAHPQAPGSPVPPITAGPPPQDHINQIPVAPHQEHAKNNPGAIPPVGSPQAAAPPPAPGLPPTPAGIPGVSPSAPAGALGQAGPAVPAGPTSPATPPAHPTGFSWEGSIPGKLAAEAAAHPISSNQVSNLLMHVLGRIGGAIKGAAGFNGAMPWDTPSPAQAQFKPSGYGSEYDQWAANLKPADSRPDPFNPGNIYHADRPPTFDANPPEFQKQRAADLNSRFPGQPLSQSPPATVPAATDQPAAPLTAIPGEVPVRTLRGPQEGSVQLPTQTNPATTQVPVSTEDPYENWLRQNMAQAQADRADMYRRGGVLAQWGQAPGANFVDPRYARQGQAEKALSDYMANRRHENLQSELVRAKAAHANAQAYAAQEEADPLHAYKAAQAFAGPGAGPREVLEARRLAAEGQPLPYGMGPKSTTFAPSELPQFLQSPEGANLAGSATLYGQINALRKIQGFGTQGGYGNTLARAYLMNKYTPKQFAYETQAPWTVWSGSPTAQQHRELMEWLKTGGLETLPTTQ